VGKRKRGVKRNGERGGEKRSGVRETEALGETGLWGRETGDGTAEKRGTLSPHRRAKEQ